MKLFANVDKNGRCLSFGLYEGIPENGYPLDEIPRASDGMPDAPRRYEVIDGKLVINETLSIEVDAEIAAEKSAELERATQAEYISQLESALAEIEEALNG